MTQRRRRGRAGPLLPRRSHRLDRGVRHVGVLRVPRVRRVPGQVGPGEGRGNRGHARGERRHPRGRRRLLRDAVQPHRQARGRRRHRHLSHLQRQGADQGTDGRRHRAADLRHPHHLLLLHRRARIRGVRLRRHVGQRPSQRASRGRRPKKREGGAHGGASSRGFRRDRRRLHDSPRRLRAFHVLLLHVQRGQAGGHEHQRDAAHARRLRLRSFIRRPLRSARRRHLHQSRRRGCRLGGKGGGGHPGG